MPIYEYQCGNCGAIHEHLVLDKNEELSCNSCNSKNLTKLISAHNTVGSDQHSGTMPHGGCCGAPNSCGSPGSCCSG